MKLSLTLFLALVVASSAHIWQCNSNADCKLGSICDNHTCLEKSPLEVEFPRCSIDHPLCPKDTHCCSGRCLNSTICAKYTDFLKTYKPHGNANAFIGDWFGVAFKIFACIIGAPCNSKYGK